MCIELLCSKFDFQINLEGGDLEEINSRGDANEVAVQRYTHEVSVFFQIRHFLDLTPAASLKQSVGRPRRRGGWYELPPSPG